ncbi:Imm74 family immunity protein [Amycolatopsis sp. GM8]|uniref:Imm74 family immunity protein n=1 Tax=Amycolatopsis sp. GM8 TaxID=2896530 RepID=UPI0035AC042B
MIVGSTRGYIELDIDGRTVRVHGEGFHGELVDYVLDRSSITHWNDGSEVTDSERESILDDLRASALQHGLTIEIE